MAIDISYLKATSYFQNSLYDYAIATLVVVIAIALLRIFKFVIVKKLKKIFNHTKTHLDDVVVNSIDSIKWPFYVMLSLYIGTKFLTLPKWADSGIYYVLLIGVIYYAIMFVQSIIDYGAEKYAEKHGKDGCASINVMGRLFKGALWGTAIVLLLSNLGYDVSALLAGLGIGGVAIAFALQNVLGDIFASFSIFLDKPFKIGDFIIIGEDMGVVRKIGIKSTRLESLWGNDIIISNRELTNIRIHNYRTMQKRRVVLPFGVTYETPQKKLEKIPQMIQEIIKGIKNTKIDRVHMKSFGESSLNFEIVYYVDTGDYNKHMDVQQQIHFAIKDRFEKENIEFAYPTRTIFMNK